jgi:hypothetical protein
VTYIHVYSDTAGDSHFEEVEVDFRPIDVAPPAPPVNVADAMASERMMLMSFPQGWCGDWHPAPRRQFYIQLSGELASATAEAVLSLLERSSFWKTYQARAT